MVIILIISFRGASLVVFNINGNQIILMIVFVVRSIFLFVSYYIGGDVAMENFKLLKLMFLILIIFILSSYRLLMFIRWERIRVISICLIGYWIRPMAKSGAMSAIIYNRWGDLVFLMFMFAGGELIVFVVLLAIICKSSLYLYQYWLPVAMEGPTPVSSLLHSSTIVVAGVYLIILLPVKVIVVVVVLILSINIVGHMDVKKNIAYSTSIHLLVIVLLSCSRFYSIVVVYIILHGIIKGQLFQSSGYEIHGVGSQDIRKFSIVGSTMMIFSSMMMLSAIIGIVIMGSKEIVVLRIISLMIIYLVVLSMIYTVVYLNKRSIISKVGEAEGSYVLLVMLMSIMVVDVNFGV